MFAIAHTNISPRQNTNHYWALQTFLRPLLDPDDLLYAPFIRIVANKPILFFPVDFYFCIGGIISLFLQSGHLLDSFKVILPSLCFVL